jgi:glycerol kinase
MKYILAIDQGTTGSRAIIYDRNGYKVASAYEEFPQYFPKPGWVEHRPDEIWKSVNNTLQKVLSQVPAGAIAGIGITNQRETTVVWDRATGKPVYNAIVWQCRRTASRCDQLKKIKGQSDFFRKRTGLPIDAYFSATKIEWILKNVPKAMSRARKGELCFGTADSWVLWKLTGGKVHATDHTNASRTMLFNIRSKTWDKELLKKFNIPASLLPGVRRSSGFFGSTIKINKLPPGVPICGIAGDQQAALFGQACFEPGTMKNTYGTGAFMLLNTGNKFIISRTGLITTLGCGAKGEPIYVLEGAIFIAGAGIQWMRDQLKLLKSSNDSQKMAQAVKDNAEVYFVPAFVGLGAPYWDQNCRGAIFGLTRGTTANHIVRAGLEAICFQTRDVIEAMEKDSGLSIKDLRVDGGASGNDFLCQFQADILGIKVIRPKVIEITSWGAAFLAGLALGYWKNSKRIKNYWKIDKVFNPKMPAKDAARIYSGWINAVNRTLS